LGLSDFNLKYRFTVFFVLLRSVDCRNDFWPQEFYAIFVKYLSYGFMTVMDPKLLSYNFLNILYFSWIIRFDPGNNLLDLFRG